jgi:hypothetical protein
MNPQIETQVRLRANHCCEYCLLPQAAFKRPFHIEHIIARQHGGQTILENLALACWYCNAKKGPNLSGIDPETGQAVLLFNPRQHRWRDHFHLLAQPTGQPTILASRGEIIIAGRSPLARATVMVLDMNSPFRCQLRFTLTQEGLYVPPSA